MRPCKYLVQIQYLICHFFPGACRGVVFGGGITPDLPPNPVLCPPPRIQNFLMLLLVLHSVRRVSFDLVNHYFLTAPSKMRKIGGVACTLHWAIRNFSKKLPLQVKTKSSARPCQFLILYAYIHIIKRVLRCGTSLFISFIK